jgi:hypothetical protein
MGMDISEKGSTIPLWKKKPKRCVLMDELKCSYFETAILAGIPMMSNEKNQIEAEEAETIYKERNKPHEFGLSQGCLVGTGPNGTVRVQQETGAQADPRRRACGNKVGKRIVRIPGRRRN